MIKRRYATVRYISVTTKTTFRLMIFNSPMNSKHSCCREYIDLFNSKFESYCLKICLVKTLNTQKLFKCRLNTPVSRGSLYKLESISCAAFLETIWY